MKLKLDTLKIMSYELKWDSVFQGNVTLERIYGINIERWVIRLHSKNALGKTPCERGFFHFTEEPSPSSRDEEYYHEYRWSSALSALQFWNDNRDRIVASHTEKARYWNA